jgi:major vault protein
MWIRDNNTNVTRIECGPLTYTRPEHETITSGPSKMVLVPPRHYVVIRNPVVRDASNSNAVVKEESGAYKLRAGDEEIRFEQPPFPLYPGEELSSQGVAPLQVVGADCALQLRAVRDFLDDKPPLTRDQVVQRVSSNKGGKGKKKEAAEAAPEAAVASTPVPRSAGDEWMFFGPGTYIPRVEVTVVEVVRAIVIQDNTALKLRARRQFVTAEGVSRDAGEEWLERKVGAYLPSVNEEVLGVIRATILTDRKALHLRANCSFTDVFGKQRQAGQEWLVTINDASTHIPDVHETVVDGDVHVTTLSTRQFCVVVNPVGADGNPKWGQRELRVGEAVFFLRPGENLEHGIQSVFVLGEDEALLLCANEAFTEAASGDAKGVERKAGERWMVHGPRDFIPPIQVRILETRRTIPLSENEGIYVRDLNTGAVRSVIGQSYLLKANEELWEKPLPEVVEALLAKQGRERGTGSVRSSARDATRVVTYRAPHNSAVQVYDYKKNIARVFFGPELVMLAPDEEFTVLSLSGGTPKEADQIQSLALLLGPDFMTDVTVVETSDHCRLSIRLAYNWHFDAQTSEESTHQALFSVSDFVGDTCKALSALVRAAVASSTFDDFHRHSARIIRSAVFGTDPASGKVLDKLVFPTNRLVITNIDIQSVEPVDQRTRDALSKSVQLAIEITTKSQEAAARHEAERNEQASKGKLHLQRLSDLAEAEDKRSQLVQLQVKSASVEAIGQMRAEAQARSEAQLIAGQSEVKAAELRARAAKLRGEAELNDLKARQDLEVEHKKLVTDLQIAKAKKLAEVESAKFAQQVEALGRDTIKAMALAGPEMQAELLGSLGLSSVIITDGNSPVNLFSTASGLVGGNTDSN